MGNASPTLLQQFGPMIAASIALVGAMIALIVNGRREEQRNKTARDDDYRREQRQALAGLLVAAQTYRREAQYLGTNESWLAADFPQATAMKDRTDQSSGDLLNMLTVARLIVHGEALQTALDDAFLQWRETDAHIQPIVDAFFAERPDLMAAAIDAIDKAWPAFATSMAALQSLALTELKPTIA